MEFRCPKCGCDHIIAIRHGTCEFHYEFKNNELIKFSIEKVNKPVISCFCICQECDKMWAGYEGENMPVIPIVTQGEQT